jgi:hypothetical protein
VLILVPGRVRAALWCTLSFLALSANADCVFPATNAPHATAVIYNPHYPHSLSTSHGHADRIYIDDENVKCELHPGDYVVIPLSPGIHSLRSSNKNAGVKVNFKANTVHYYRFSYDDAGWTVSTSLQPPPPESVIYDLQRMKPEKGETKPLPDNPVPSE